MKLDNAIEDGTSTRGTDFDVTECPMDVAEHNPQLTNITATDAEFLKLIAAVGSPKNDNFEPVLDADDDAEKYVSGNSHWFSNLTSLQRGVDEMFVATLKKADENNTAPVLCTFDKLIVIWEGLMPTNGFINKLAHPTSADLAVLFVVQYINQQAGGLDVLDRCRKCRAIAHRTAVAGGVKEYLGYV
jgi:hypothetical protein